MFASNALRLKGEAGLTLVEIMVAMMIFLVVSAGIAGTFITGLKATVQARQATMGKAEAQEQIEEMRSRIFFIPYSTSSEIGTTSDVDLLDRYYPDMVTSPTTDGWGWSRWYTETAGDAYYTTESPADSRGIIRTVEVRFVDNDGDVVVPSSSYDTNESGSDTPPSNLVEVSVTTSWQGQNGENSFELDSLISATGQTVQGAGDAEGEAGCESNSNSYVDTIGGIFVTSTGSAEPYTTLVSGNFGEAHATMSTGCETSLTARATGGNLAIVGGSTYTGADASAAGPPESVEEDGPVSTGPPATWPKPTITNSYVEAEIEVEEEEGGGEIEAEGEASVGSLSLQLSQIDGTPGGSVSGYRRWDFINPIVTVTGGVDFSDDETEDQDDQVEAEIEQVGGETVGESEIFYKQVNIVPLTNITSSRPKALQGLVFIRDFKVEAESQATGIPGGASNQLSYSATVGMWNASKAGTCSGDGCYDLYSISPANPLQNINLNNTNYRIQKALFTEWYSFTTADVNDAMVASEDGTTAGTSIDALVKISAMYGTEVRWKTANPQINSITLISKQGLQQVWLGAIDMSVFQEA